MWHRSTSWRSHLLAELVDEAGRSAGGVGPPGALAGVQHLAHRGVQVDGHRPITGPAPAAHGRRRLGEPVEWRTCPKVNERRKVPKVEGAMTRWPSTWLVAPQRSRSASSMAWVSSKQMSSWARVWEDPIEKVPSCRRRPSPRSEGLSHNRTGTTLRLNHTTETTDESGSGGPS
jgi:hypothetical protein